MRANSRTMRRGLTIVTAITAIGVLNATTANAAITIPTWEPGGYLPACDTVNAVSLIGGGIAFEYFDNTKPSLGSFTPNPLVRVGSTATSHRIFSMRATDACSGVGVMAATLQMPNGSLFQAGGTPTSGTVHNATFTYEGVIDPATTTLFGKVTYLDMFAQDQYNTFDLSGDLKTVTPKTYPTGTSKVAFSQKNYGLVTIIAKDTKLTNSVNRSRVRAGRSVTFSGNYSLADTNAYFGGIDRKIKLQRRLAGSRTWSTIATKRTGGSYPAGTAGNVSFTIFPTKTADYRLVYSGALVNPFWEAPVTSVSKRVTVI